MPEDVYPGDADYERLCVAFGCYDTRPKYFSWSNDHWEPVW